MRPSSAGGASTRAVLVEVHSLTQSSAKSPASGPSAVASSAARVATGGRRIEAAQLLGIGRNTISRKIQDLGMDEGRSGDGDEA